MMMKTMMEWGFEVVGPLIYSEITVGELQGTTVTQCSQSRNVIRFPADIIIQRSLGGREKWSRGRENFERSFTVEEKNKSLSIHGNGLLYIDFLTGL